MGIFDFFKRKPMDNGSSTDEQMKKEVEQKMQMAQSEQEMSTLISSDFVMNINDVFTIPGRGTIVSGEIQSGTINLNDTVVIDPTGIITTVMGIEQFRKQVETAHAGEIVGILLSNVSKENIPNGSKLKK